MTGEPFNKMLSDEAIAWFTLLESGEVRADDYHSFARWRALSPAHEQAFDHINGLWNDLDGLQPEMFTQAIVQKPMLQTSSTHKEGLSRWAVSLCGLLLFIVGGVMWTPDYLLQFASDYRTGTGEQKSFTLADGSQVMLDAGSALSVDYSAKTRQLTLYQGRAYFTVAADKQRPFVVASGDGKSQALGSEFELYHTDQAVAVTVFESAVQVSIATQAARLIAGQRLDYSGETGLSQPRDVDLRQAGAWRRGRLVFTDRPLSEVIDEINRYRQGFIVIIDESLRDFSVSGVFDLTRPDAILETLVEVLPIRQRSLTPFLVLLDRA